MVVAFQKPYLRDLGLAVVKRREEEVGKTGRGEGRTHLNDKGSQGGSVTGFFQEYSQSLTVSDSDETNTNILRVK